MVRVLQNQSERRARTLPAQVHGAVQRRIYLDLTPHASDSCLQGLSIGPSGLPGKFCSILYMVTLNLVPDAHPWHAVLRRVKLHRSPTLGCLRSFDPV